MENIGGMIRNLASKTFATAPAPIPLKADKTPYGTATSTGPRPSCSLPRRAPRAPLRKIFAKTRPRWPIRKKAPLPSKIRPCRLLGCFQMIRASSLSIGLQIFAGRMTLAGDVADDAAKIGTKRSQVLKARLARLNCLALA